MEDLPLPLLLVSLHDTNDDSTFFVYLKMSFVYLKMSLFHLQFWKIFLLDIKMLMDNLFLLTTLLFSRHCLCWKRVVICKSWQLYVSFSLAAFKTFLLFWGLNSLAMIWIKKYFLAVFWVTRNTKFKPLTKFGEMLALIF